MLGALGACFGRVVTIDSPKARPPGTFNWGETLWHEMAHVITLQLSNNRLPRWLSEGTSTYEERRARKEWGRDMDIPFARFLDQRQGAEDPRSQFRVHAARRRFRYAYYQASLLVEHIVDTYGQRKLRALVAAYGDGSDTEAAIKKALGVDIDELQKSFDAMLDKRYAGLRRALKVPEGLAPGLPLDKIKAIAADNPESFAAQMTLGEALAESNPDAAIEAFERAAKLIPNVRRRGQPVRGDCRRGDEEGRQGPRRARARTAHGEHAIRRRSRRAQLATLLDPAKEAARTRTALQRVVAVDPFDAQAHATLGQLAHESRRQRRGHSILPRRGGVEAARPRQRARRPRRSLVGGRTEGRGAQAGDGSADGGADVHARAGSAVEAVRRIAVMRRWIWATSLAAAVLWFASDSPGPP